MINVCNCLNSSWDFKDPVSEQSLMMKCEDYIKKQFSLLQSMFGSTLDATNFTIDNYSIRYAYHGSKNIIDFIDNACLICDDINAVCLLKSLKPLVLELLSLSIYSDEQRIEFLLKEIGETRTRIQNYYKIVWGECGKEPCKASMKLVADSLPHRSYVLGCFLAGGCYYQQGQIVIYSKSIGAISNSKDSFNASFWSTVSHETFHAYHYAICREKNENGGHWFERNPRFGDDGLEINNHQGLRHEHMKESDTKSSPEFDKPNDNDSSVLDQLEGFPTDSYIVKESLASYYEYYSNKYGLNASVPVADIVANNLLSSWNRHSIRNWPYSGAKAFAFDKEMIADCNCLFRSVLDTSLYDWTQACDLIINNI